MRVCICVCVSAGAINERSWMWQYVAVCGRYLHAHVPHACTPCVCSGHEIVLSPRVTPRIVTHSTTRYRAKTYCLNSYCCVYISRRCGWCGREGDNITWDIMYMDHACSQHTSIHRSSQCHATCHVQFVHHQHHLCQSQTSTTRTHPLASTLVTRYRTCIG